MGDYLTHKVITYCQKNISDECIKFLKFLNSGISYLEQKRTKNEILRICFLGNCTSPQELSGLLNYMEQITLAPFKEEGISANNYSTVSEITKRYAKMQTAIDLFKENYYREFK